MVLRRGVRKLGLQFATQLFGSDGATKSFRKPIEGREGTLVLAPGFPGAASGEKHVSASGEPSLTSLHPLHDRVDAGEGSVHAAAAFLQFEGVKLERRHGAESADAVFDSLEGPGPGVGVVREDGAGTGKEEVRPGLG